MKSIVQYIIESGNKVKATTEWMVEKYAYFNEIYFNNELPKRIELKAIKVSNETWLGEQGEHYGYYISRDYMENGMYRMYKKRKGMHTVKRGKSLTWEDTIDPDTPIKSITELAPYIHISTRYDFDPDELEDTMIHEMVHLYTFKDGLAPKQAHGKEFKAKCKEIRLLAESKYNKHYSLGTKATDSSRFELNDEEKKAQELAIKANALKGGGIYSIYFILKDTVKSTKYPQTERFLFCTKNMVPKITDIIKRSDKGNILNMYISGESYEEACKIYGQFKTVRKYCYWDLAKYPKLKELFMNNAKDIINENMIDEDKKPYIKPMMNIIEIPADINLSDVNLEDILNGVEKTTKGEDKEGNTENNKNMITHE